jgi:hypothetical protein
MVRQAAIDVRIAALAAGQGGAVSRLQLVAMGLSCAAIDQRVRRGRLHVVHRGVYAVGHPVLGTRGRWFAALLSCPGAALSYETAGAGWDLRRVPAGRIELTAPRAAGTGRGSGLLVHRGRLAPDEVTQRDGLAMTTLERTLLDLAAFRPVAAVEQLVRRAEALRVLDVASLSRLLARHPGRPGSPALREVLAEWDPVSAGTRSELEERLLVVCAGAGLPRPLVNAHVAGLEVDLSWPAARLVVELDGFAFHATRDAFERDRRRDAALALAGWRVLRFSWRQVTREPVVVAAAIERAITH